MPNWLWECVLSDLVRHDCPFDSGKHGMCRSSKQKVNEFEQFFFFWFVIGQCELVKFRCWLPIAHSQGKILPNFGSHNIWHLSCLRSGSSVALSCWYHRWINNMKIDMWSHFANVWLHHIRNVIWWKMKFRPESIQWYKPKKQNREISYRKQLKIVSVVRAETKN